MTHDKECEMLGGNLRCNCADRAALLTGYVSDRSIRAAREVTDFVLKQGANAGEKLKQQQFRLALLIQEICG